MFFFSFLFSHFVLRCWSVAFFSFFLPACCRFSFVLFFFLFLFFVVGLFLFSSFFTGIFLNFSSRAPSKCYILLNILSLDVCTIVIQARYHAMMACLASGTKYEYVTYSYACRNIVNTIKTNETQFFRKIYPSLNSKGLRKGYVRVVSWRLNKDSNILTPSSPGYSSTSFSSCRTAQPEHPVAPGYMIVWHPPASVSVVSALNSTRPQSRLFPVIFDRKHLLFTQVHFLFDSSAGTEVNMLQCSLKRGFPEFIPSRTKRHIRRPVYIYIYIYIYIYNSVECHTQDT